MTDRRKILLALLLVWFALLFLGDFGIVEVTLWLVLLAVWIVAFFTWGRRKTGPQH